MGRDTQNICEDQAPRVDNKTTSLHPYHAPPLPDAISCVTKKKKRLGMLVVHDRRQRKAAPMLAVRDCPFEDPSLHPCFAQLPFSDQLRHATEITFSLSSAPFPRARKSSQTRPSRPSHPWPDPCPS